MKGKNLRQGRPMLQASERFRMRSKESQRLQKGTKSQVKAKAVAKGGTRRAVVGSTEAARAQGTGVATAVWQQGSNRGRQEEATGGA